jgi:hypothetical protein
VAETVIIEITHEQAAQLSAFCEVYATDNAHIPDLAEMVEAARELQATIDDYRNDERRVLALLVLDDGMLMSGTSPRVTDSAADIKEFAGSLRDMATRMTAGWKRGKAKEKANTNQPADQSVS